jgi:hypothetical protein
MIPSIGRIIHVCIGIEDGTPVLRRLFDGNYRQTKTTISSTLTHKFNARHLLRTGTYVNMLNYRFGQLNPFGYHLFNLLVHIGNVILIFFLCRRVLFLLRMNVHSP